MYLFFADLAIASKIKQATGGRGVDVVLSSAAGAQMHELLQCLGPAGRFIEVDRTDVMDRGSLGLGVFERNITFSSFDLGILNKQRPELVAGSFNRIGLLFMTDFLRFQAYGGSRGALWSRCHRADDPCQNI